MGDSAQRKEGEREKRDAWKTIKVYRKDEEMVKREIRVEADIKKIEELCEGHAPRWLECLPGELFHTICFPL